MKLSKTIVIASLIASIASFAFYVCPLDAPILTDEQVNEVLLAVFGGGISSFFIGLTEYNNCRKELEDRFLFGVEPLLSTLGGIKECAVEPLPHIGDPVDLLAKYYDEEASNSVQLPGISSSKHEIRDRLIQSLEHSNLADCERTFSDEKSSSRRYIARLEDSIQLAVKEYLGLADRLPSGDDVYILKSKMSYFPLSSKRKLIDSIADKFNKARSEFKGVIEQCRLFEKGECHYGELLKSIKDIEASQQRCCRGKEVRNDRSAAELYELVFQFARKCSSPYASKYEQDPWWE